MKVQKSQTLEVSQMWMICICQIKVIFATMTSFYTTQLSKISFQIERDKITELNFNPIPKKFKSGISISVPFSAKRDGHKF